MRRVFSTLHNHRHFVIVATLLTLVMTFPTVVYIFRMDVFWLPTGNSLDVYSNFWDIWYGQQLLTAQADRFYTNLIFYPEGVSLIYQPLFLPQVIVINALRVFLPISNAFSLTYLLITFSSALSAYIYLLWLLKEKWIALFGAVVFGFSPHVIGHPNHAAIAFLATVPLTIYCFHRGIKETRLALIVASGLLTGLTTITSMYAYICILMMLVFMIFAFALARWRDRSYWSHIALLVLLIAVSSLWRVYPLISDSQSLSAATEWHGEIEVKTDLISNFVNHHHPILGPLANTILQTPESERLSGTSFLGYIPLLLICIGVFNPATRRKMLPWMALWTVFLTLRLGSVLTANGTVFPGFLLPKFYLNQLLPPIFASFFEADIFMMGALLPHAILACFGIVALRERRPGAYRPWFALLLIGIVAFEFHIPVRGNLIPQEQFAFLDWLAEEEDSGEIRLINLPMGRGSSKRYNLYQSLSGYPHAEGAISRTPDSAFDYIRANQLLNAWHNQLPIHCEMTDRDAYLSGLAQLEQDGFSHIVYHRQLKYWDKISESFRYVEPAYSDGFVSIYRLSDLRDSCTDELGARLSFTRAYTDALQKSSIIDERHGTIVIFPPTLQVSDHFNWYLRQFASIDKTVMTITTGKQSKIDIQSSESRSADPYTALGSHNAVWLVNDRQEFNAEQTEAYQEWFMERFKYCARFHEDDDTAIDLYLRSSIPCSAMDTSSALGVRYDGGVRLHNLSYDVSADAVRVFLSWTNDTNNNYSFSIQFFDEDGQKTLQYDNVIYPDLLEVREIDISSLPDGMNTVKLIVYDFETRVSRGGTVSDTAERFERELEVAKIEVDR